MAEYFIVTTPGIEAITQAELGAIGIEAQVETGGLTVKGGLLELYKANYLLRTANRVLARVGQPFMARTYEELGQRASALPWEQYLDGKCTLRFHVSCSRSKLMHSGVVAKSVGRAIQRRLSVSEMVEGEEQEVHVRIHEDKVTISMDASGEMLYKRGYRQQVTRSPMRETLAAALIFASSWDKATPLIDPFCGSGTIPVEAALIAKGVPAGVLRNFAFQRWPNFDKAAWQQARSYEMPKPAVMPAIFGYDRDAGAIEISKANAERAGVADLITFGHQALSHLQNGAARGWVVTNPPYGVRVSEGADLRNLYAQFGNVLRARLPGWHVALVTNAAMLSGHAALRLTEVAKVSNGGIQTIFQTGSVPKGY